MRVASLTSILFLLCASTVLAQDAPEISRSRGEPGGILVLWPRVVPGPERARSLAQALEVQKRLEALVRRALPGRKLDLRPRPERACPRAGGCKAVSVGALLIRRQDGCALVALISGPGESAARLIRWAGDLTIKRDYSDFRQPPENQVQVQDFARCDALGPAMDGQEKAVEEALRFALTGVNGKR